jgi:RNA polymerase sigma-70 factor (ECF subfamily)
MSSSSLRQEVNVPNQFATGDIGGHDRGVEFLAFIPDLQKFARSLCRDRDAVDDLVQDTLLRAWANASQFSPGTNLGAWLFTILRNTFLSERRKWGREAEDPDGRYAGSLRTLATQEAHVEQQDLARALARLSHDQHQALMLVAAHGLSYEDAAHICNCPVGTIKSRVQRARTRLAALMGLDPRADLGPDPITRAALQLAA